MSLYKNTDIDLLHDSWDSILERVEMQRYSIIEPTKEEIIKVHNIICDYIKEHKRKIYGGFALNLLLIDKNPSEKIYKDNQIPDIDFYSPDPMSDLIKICNILHTKGFKLISGKEAQHINTYNINVNYLTYCDLTYVPRNIYNKMPFKEINGYTVIHPHFMWIDYLRIFTDPMTSYWRMGNDLKSFKRFYLLQKNFTLPFSDHPIEIEGSTSTLDNALNQIYNFCIGKKSLIMIGFYAYNYFLHTSGLNKKYKLVQIPYYEIISINFRFDCLQLLDTLNQLNSIDNSKLTHVEFYPFFQFTDNSLEIYYNGDLIVRIYNHNKKSIPYQDVLAINFSQKHSEQSVQINNNNFIRMATFPTVLMYSIISIMKARTQSNDDDKNLYFAVTSHLIEARKYYFNRTKKTILDDSIFKEFVSDCIGSTLPPDRERKLIIENRKKNGKRWMFSYEPADGMKEPENTYLFPNLSGNKILNPKHLKLTTYVVEENLEGDFDENQIQHNNKISKNEEHVTEIPGEFSLTSSESFLTTDTVDVVV